MNRFQSFTCNVGVDLCGGDIRVTEQQLHNAKIRPMIDQVCGEGVAQYVRRDCCRDAGLEGVALDDVPKHLARHGGAADRDEQIIGWAAVQNFSAGLVHVAL